MVRNLQFTEKWIFKAKYRYSVHVNPRNNQSFMYLNLAISLIIDLGLDQEAPNPNNFSAIKTDGLIEAGSFTVAAKRAYLGCYWLSSALVFSVIFSLRQETEWTNCSVAYQWGFKNPIIYTTAT
jgi:hypothetical protein